MKTRDPSIKTSLLRELQGFFEYWDQVSFDQGYKSKKLSHFEPMLKQVFSRKAYDPKILLNGFVTSLETTTTK